MVLTLRGEVYHWRTMIDGVKFAKSTKMADRKQAEQQAILWEGEANYFRQLASQATKVAA